MAMTLLFHVSVHCAAPGEAPSVQYRYEYQHIGYHEPAAGHDFQSEFPGSNALASRAVASPTRTRIPSALLPLAAQPLTLNQPPRSY